ncbi:hypothetical protein V8E53_008168 [Lactarius tabidus]
MSASGLVLILVLIGVHVRVGHPRLLERTRAYMWCKTSGEKNICKQIEVGGTPRSQRGEYCRETASIAPTIGVVLDSRGTLGAPLRTFSLGAYCSSWIP